MSLVSLHLEPVGPNMNFFLRMEPEDLNPVRFAILLSLCEMKKSRDLDDRALGNLHARFRQELNIQRPVSIGEIRRGQEAFFIALKKLLHAFSNTRERGPGHNSIDTLAISFELIQELYNCIKINLREALLVIQKYQDQMPLIQEKVLGLVREYFPEESDLIMALKEPEFYINQHIHLGGVLLGLA